MTRFNLIVLVFCFLILPIHSFAAEKKEWTLIVFINGHNNLDQYSAPNIQQMTKVGSSENVNIVVQWASLANKRTKRLYIQKDHYDVIEDLPPVDMGDYRNLVEFAKWTTSRYPAKKYLIEIWNHGSGWRQQDSPAIRDISSDDLTKHKITTEQLGIAMKEISQIIEGKIELYASDACLMNMIEVATQMSESVKYYAGSEEIIPATGWPYTPFLQKLIANPTMDGAEVGKVLAREYKNAYSGGEYGKSDVTFSVFDLSKISEMNLAISHAASELKNLNKNQIRTAFNSAIQTIKFTFGDYLDFGDFISHVKTATNTPSTQTVQELKNAQSHFVIANETSPRFQKAEGFSIWLPTNKSQHWDPNHARYQNLEFNRQTGWGDFVNALVHAY